MQNSIVAVFVSLTAYILMSSAQQQPTTWTNPYFFYHYNNPLAMPTPEKITVNEMTGNQKVFSGHDDYSMANTLGSHVVMLSTCLRELKTTKADLVQTHTEVESVKKELNEMKENSQLLPNLLTKLENLKKEINDMIKISDLAHTTQRLDATNAVVESVKKELNELKANSAASSIGRMPHSCEDLHKIGHKKSGFFTVMGNKTVDNIYCDFTKPTNDAGFQKMIGYFNVKTSPVYFHAQKTKSLTTGDTVVPFELLRLNLGGGMSTSGIFVAPKSGKYFFTYSGIGESNTHSRVEMQIKTETVDWTKVGQAYGHVTHQSFSLHATFELTKGNQIRLKLIDGTIRDHDSHYTNYVGQLLEEDIIQ